MTSEHDVQQLRRLVQWLDEERQRAHGQIEQLAAQVKALVNAEGVRGQAIAAVEADLRRLRGLEQRFGHLEQASRDALEPLAALRLRLEALERDVAQHAATRDVGFERLQRQANELAQAVERLSTADAHLGERLGGLADELRRDRAALHELGAQVAELRQMCTALSGRLALAEQDLQRAAEHLGRLERQVQAVAREQERQREALQLMQLQTQRQFGEWDERAAEWQRTVAGSHAASQAAREQAQMLAADLADVRALAERKAEELAAQETNVSAWQAQQTTLAHELAALRAEAALDRQRLHELAGQVAAFPQQLEMAQTRTAELAVRLATQREHGEQLQAALQRLERQLAELEERQRATTRDLRAQLDDVREAVASASREGADLARRLHQRIAELQQLEEQHRQRQIAELEQQLHELRDKAHAPAKVEAT